MYSSKEIAVDILPLSLIMSFIPSVLLEITALELSDIGIKARFFLRIGNPFALKKTYLRWDEIRGMIVCYSSSTKERFLKIFYNHNKENLKYLGLRLKIFRDADKLVTELRSMLPDIKNDDSIFDNLREVPSAHSMVKFKNIILSSEGLRYSNQKIIPWSDVKVISYEDRGFGPITITYDDQNSINHISIKPKWSEDFNIFLRHLIKNAKHSSIDPSLLKILTSKFHRMENLFLKLFIILATFILLYIIVYVLII